MKKIMYIHHGDTAAGAPRSLKFLLSKINREKYEPVVVCRNSEKDLSFFSDVASKCIYWEGIRPFHCSTVTGLTFKQAIYNFVYALPTYFATKKLIKSENPDIIHLNSSCLCMCAMAAKRTNKKIQVVCHIREPLLNNWIANFVRRICNRYCDNFVSIDEYDGRNIDPHLKKTTVVYNFVDFSVYNSKHASSVLRDELSVSAHAMIFLVLARVSPENGMLELIKEWGKINIQNEAHLVIVGLPLNEDNEYTTSCQSLAEKYSDIHLLKFRRDVTDVIASSDVMLCPFIQPHFARAIIEAAAMGKPSLSKWIDGPKELVVDKVTGLFYDDGENTLEQQVNFLCNNKAKVIEYGKNAEKRAVEKFNIDVNAEKTFSIYK